MRRLGLFQGRSTSFWLGVVFTMRGRSIALTGDGEESFSVWEVESKILGKDVYIVAFGKAYEEDWEIEW